MKPSFTRLTKEQAIEIGHEALIHLANNEALLIDFIQETGISTSEFETLSKRDDFYVSLLNFYRQDDARLVVFCANTKIEVKELNNAYYFLRGENAAH